MRTVCLVCRAAFDRPVKSTRLTCTRKCAVALSWKNAGTRARRIQGIKAERATPKAKARQAETNRKRWARPGEREKLAERNRAMWQDPVKKLALCDAIIAAWGAEPRAKLRAIKLKQWQDPAYRERHVAAVRAALGKPEYRLWFSKRLKRRWADPKWRAAMTAAIKRAQNDPKVLAKHIARMEALWASAEGRAKMMAGAKKAGVTRTRNARAKRKPVVLSKPWTELAPVKWRRPL